MSARVRRTLAILVLLAGVACGRDASGEARMFLDRLERLDLDDPPADRRRLVDNLANMPLSDAEVTEARDVCVDAHRNILEAEDLQADAARLLARYEADQVPSAGDRARIQRDIQSADAALARSRDLFSRCHRQTRELDVRYRRRR